MVRMRAIGISEMSTYLKNEQERGTDEREANNSRKSMNARVRGPPQYEETNGERNPTQHYATLVW